MPGSNTSECSWQDDATGPVANTEGNGLACALRSGQATTETLLGSTRLKCLAATKNTCKKSVQPSPNSDWFFKPTITNTYMRHSQRPRTKAKHECALRLLQLKNGGECLLLCQVTCCLAIHFPSTVATWQLVAKHFQRRVTPKITRFRWCSTCGNLPCQTTLRSLIQLDNPQPSTVVQHSHESTFESYLNFQATQLHGIVEPLASRRTCAVHTLRGIHQTTNAYIVFANVSQSVPASSLCTILYLPLDLWHMALTDSQPTLSNIPANVQPAELQYISLLSDEFQRCCEVRNLYTGLHANGADASWSNGTPVQNQFCIVLLRYDKL